MNSCTKATSWPMSARVVSLRRWLWPVPLLMMVGCSTTPAADPAAATSNAVSTSITTTTDRGGLLLVGPGGAHDASVSGVLRLDEAGCWQLEDSGEPGPALVAWPRGSRWADDSPSPSVQLPGGKTVSNGTQIQGGGSVAQTRGADIQLDGDRRCLKEDTMQSVAVLSRIE